MKLRTHLREKMVILKGKIILAHQICGRLGIDNFISKNCKFSSEQIFFLRE